MTWWKRSRPRSSKPPRSVDSVRLLLDGWRVVDTEVLKIVWLDGNGDALSLVFTRERPARELFAGKQALRACCRLLAEERGAGLIEARRLADWPAIDLITKIPNGSGFMYTGMLVVDAGPDSYMWVISAPERGVTGLRLPPPTRSRPLANSCQATGWPSSWTSSGPTTASTSTGIGEPARSCTSGELGKKSGRRSRAVPTATPGPKRVHAVGSRDQLVIFAARLRRRWWPRSAVRPRGWDAGSHAPPRFPDALGAPRAPASARRRLTDPANRPTVPGLLARSAVRGDRDDGAA